MAEWIGEEAITCHTAYCMFEVADRLTGGALAKPTARCATESFSLKHIFDRLDRASKGGSFFVVKTRFWKFDVSF